MPAFVKRLDEAVEKAKKNEEWRREYMTLLMRDRENIEKGIEQGIEQGIVEVVLNMRQKDVPLEKIAELIGKPLDWVKEMLEKYGKTVV